MKLKDGVTLEPTKEQVNLANSKPLAYVLVVVVALLGVVTTMYFKSDSNNRVDCKEQVTQLQAEKIALLKALLSQTSEIKDIKKNTDSVIRAKLKPNTKKSKHEN